MLSCALTLYLLVPRPFLSLLHLLCFCRWREEPEFRRIIGEAGYEVRNVIVWDKGATGMGDLDGAFASQYELILYAVKGSPTLFSRPSDLARVPRVPSKRHPTEKPVELLARYIEATTAKGELVVDPFGGVANTLVAAKRLGRRYWGCETKSNYYAIGEERLAAVEPNGGDRQ